MIITKDAQYRINVTASQREYTDEGYLKVPARLARCGIYKYRASELGITQIPPDTVVRVYRPESEVFNKKSLDSFMGAVITDDHPPEMVDSKNFKKYELGTVMSAGRKDGDYVQADLLIRDSDTIRKIEAGKEELSAGYRCQYEYELINGQLVAGDYGVDESGVIKKASSEYGEFDVIQRNVKVNHVALVSAGRAGQEVRVFDNDIVNRSKSAMKITLDTGAMVDINEGNAEHIVAHISNQNKKILKLQSQISNKDSEHKKALDSIDESLKEKSKALEEANAKSDAKDEKIKKLEAQVNDHAANQGDSIKNALNVLEQCRQVAGDEFACDSYDELEMKTKALEMTIDSIDIRNKDKAYTMARFDIAYEDAQKQRTEAATYDSQIKNLTGVPDGVETNDSKPVTSRSEDRQKLMNGGL